MVFSLTELLDVILMTLIVGYLFKDAFRVPKTHEDVLDMYRARSGIWNRDWHDLIWAAALIAPSILLHELGHKFTAMFMGYTATFHAACSTAAIGVGFFNFTCNIQLFAVLMKAMGYGFLIFVPAFVSISGGATHLQSALISFMGPLIHLVFWLGAAHMLRNPAVVRKWPKRKQIYVYFFKKINMFLFILNMIPIPGFDGFWTFFHLFKAFV